MTDQNNSTLVNNISYGPAGELLTMSYLGYNESRLFAPLGAGGMGEVYCALDTQLERSSPRFLRGADAGCATRRCAAR